MVSDTTRAPCPWRIIEDAGGAFAMGLIGSAIFQFSKGAWFGARGRRLLTGYMRMRDTAPVRGGQFAAWGGLFAAFDCTCLYVRRREDSWNSIMSGGLAASALACRRGYGAMATNFVFGSVLLALIEGAGLWMQKFQSQWYQPQKPASAATTESPLSSSNSTENVV